MPNLTQTCHGSPKVGAAQILEIADGGELAAPDRLPPDPEKVALGGEVGEDLDQISSL